MENKYYTPEIEEFSVGFEYEEYIAGSNTEYVSKFWSPEDHFVLNVFENNFQEGWLRVKCLDQKDIESLGFKLDPIRSYFNYRNSFSSINEPYKLSLDHIYNENKIILRGHKVDYPTKTLFEGIIKNLSELKKLLKQTKNYE